MNIAIQNFYHLPQLLSRGGVHNYVLELIKQGHIKYLYFDDRFFKNMYGVPITSTIDRIRSSYSWKDLGLDKTEIIFSSNVLKSKVDVLLNFNGVVDNDMTESVKGFNGLKIFHIMDFFWIQPGSEQYKKLKKMGVDYLMSYGSCDKYSSYFQHTYPDYLGKVIPVPFGFAPRFKDTTPFEKRTQKCVALGSLLPTRRKDAPRSFWIETANFYKNEKWLHKFRRMLVESKKELSDVVDSMLPVFPDLADHTYDIVKTFNDYQMFTTCETIYYFPTAKSFEGPAAGCVQVCSNHPLFTDLGFKDGINCIRHREFDVADFKDKVNFYLKHQNKLKEIQENSTKFVRENFSHAAVANNLYNAIKQIHDQQIIGGSNIKKFSKIWTTPYLRPRISRRPQSFSINAKNYLIILLFIVISFTHIKIIGPSWSFIFTNIAKRKKF